MANIYVIDTSALISNPAVVQIPRRHWVIIPAVVLRQLDGLKNSSDRNTAYWARKASQAIEQQQRKGNLLIEGSSLDVNALDNKADNEIIGAALWARRNYVAKNVILVSTDRNMRIAAVNCGLGAEEDKKRNTRWYDVAVWSLSWFVLSIFSLIIGNLANFSEDFIVAVCISIGVSFLASLVSTVVVDQKNGGYPDDDILLDPACASIPGNIFHHYYKKDR